MKKLFYCLIVLTLLASCEKGELIEMKYHQTYCADAWELGSSATEEEISETVTRYLKDLDIKVKEVSMNDEGQAQFCNACSCTSGNIIVVKVDELFQTDLENLGFFKED